ATARRQGAMNVATPPSPASMAIPAAAISLVSGGIPHAIAAGALTAGGHAASGWFNKARQLASGNSPEMQNSLASFALAPGQTGRQVIGLLQSPQERLLAPWLPGTILSSQVPSFPQANRKGLLSECPVCHNRRNDKTKQQRDNQTVKHVFRARQVPPCPLGRPRPTVLWPRPMVLWHIGYVGTPIHGSPEDAQKKGCR